MSEKDPRAKLDRTLSLPKNLASDVKSVLLDNDLKIILRDFKLQCEHRQSQILPINDIVTQARFLTELIKNSRSELGVL
ncbi:hypothetical protein GW750_00570 [bacterium]|nr:hypothetical protein [bacterium]